MDFPDGTEDGDTDDAIVGNKLGDDDRPVLGLLLGDDDKFNDDTADGVRDEYGSHKVLQLSDTPVILYFYSISASSMLIHFYPL